MKSKPSYQIYATRHPCLPINALVYPGRVSHIPLFNILWYLEAIVARSLNSDPILPLGLGRATLSLPARV